MKWVNPKYLITDVEDGGLVLKRVHLGSEDDCVFGEAVDMADDTGERVSLHFPELASRLSAVLLKEGNRLQYVADGDKLPYSEIAATYDRLGRTYLIGSSDDGRFFVHCKLNNGHGFIAVV